MIKHSNHRFGPLFGLFDDSLPDGWGLLLMDRFFRKQGIDLARVSVLDRLLYLGRETMGALTYHPPTFTKEETEHPIDLHCLAEEAKDVFEGKAKDILQELMKAGDLILGSILLKPGFHYYPFLQIESNETEEKHEGSFGCVIGHYSL